MDKMENFERLLKEAPLREHSKDLKKRLFGPRRRGARVIEMWRQPIRLGWAAVFVAAAAMAGFSIDRVWEKPAAPEPAEVRVEVRIVESDRNRHDFDLTGGPSQFLFGDVSLEVEKQKEI